MLKFLLNLLLQICKALINSKIQFLIQKFIFPDFRPGRPRGPLGLWPSQPTGHAVPAGRNHPSRPPPPCLSDNRAPLVSSVFPTVPADPGREPSASSLPASPALRL
jgi:hypothetical protein